MPSLQDREYRVEKIVNYAMLKVTNYVGEPGYNRKLGEKRYEVCYEVKWKGYPKSENTYEPRSSFPEWHESYNQQIRLIEQANPERPTAKELERQAWDLRP
ncbi:hypothetical protein BCR35DRAFT_313467 [Leucosporidium creatinivorum]|uniref:Chromo domain-containing protein n=1 Tax=Leucosporidium creatinivorum TaxID=106004 RepID=A0A1Y2FMU1_9BASI|nr:hypothetical protein BCR35DRAFT_313467 [Leucosporidium creatinivorum]